MMYSSLLLLLVAIWAVSSVSAIDNTNNLAQRARIENLKKDAYEEIASSLKDTHEKDDPDQKRQLSVLVNLNDKGGHHHQAESDGGGTDLSGGDQPYLGIFDVTELNPWGNSMSKTFDDILALQADPDTGELTMKETVKDMDDHGGGTTTPRAALQTHKVVKALEGARKVMKNSGGGLVGESESEAAQAEREKQGNHEAFEATKAQAAAVGFQDRGCISWRQTGNCDPHYGPKEAEFDRTCIETIASGWSGYCECADGSTVAHSDCSHATFSCKERCARPEAEDLKVISQHYTDSLMDIDAKFEQSRLFVELTPENVHFLTKHVNKPLMLIMRCNCERDAAFSHILDELLENAISEDKLGLVTYAWVSKKTQDLFSLQNVFLLKGDRLPTLIMDNVPNGANVEKYILSPTKDITALNIWEFIDDFYAGQLPLILRSQAPKMSLPRPLGGTGELLDLVAINFAEAIKAPDVCVVVMVYSPSCGASQAIMPLIQQLAADLKGNEKFVITRMDHTVNDFPVGGLKITHYPTVYLWPANRKDRPLNFDDYNGSKVQHDTSVAHSHYEFETIKAFVLDHYTVSRVK